MAFHPIDRSTNYLLPPSVKVSGGGFEQCYNAQAAVDAESMLVLAPHVT